MVRTFRLLAPRTLVGRLFLLTLATLLLATLAACGGSEPATPTPTEAAAAVAIEAPTPTPIAIGETVTTVPTPGPAPVGEQPVYGGTIRIEVDIAHPDPWHLTGTQTTSRTFYNGLVELKFPYNAAKGPEQVPGLATEWFQSQDGTKWTLKLRQGVSWHDGELFNADDVVATFGRGLDRGVLIGTRPATIRNVIKSVTKVDDYTVVADSGEPNSTAFAYLANALYIMVPEHLIRGDPNSTDPKLRWKFMHPDKANPQNTGTLGVGTGPFIMKKWTPQVGTIGERNPNYWGRDDQGNRLPYADSFEYKAIPDVTRVSANFVAGLLSTCCSTGLHPQKALDLCKSTRQPGCRLSGWYPHGNYEWWLNPGGVAAFKDPKVVQATRYAVNHQKSIDGAHGGGIAFLWMDRSRFPDTALTIKEQYEVLPWSNPDRRGEFLQKTKDLLAEGGYPNGVDLPLPIFGGCTTTMLDLFTREADQFYTAGIRGFLECRAGVVIADELKSGRWSLADGPQAVWWVDPGTMVISKLLFESAALAGAPWRYEGQAEVDGKYRQIVRETDQVKRNEQYRALERHLANDKLTVWSLGFTAVVKSVHGCVRNYSPGGVWPSHVFAINFVWLTPECK